MRPWIPFRFRRTKWRLLSKLPTLQRPRTSRGRFNTSRRPWLPPKDFPTFTCATWNARALLRHDHRLRCHRIVRRHHWHQYPYQQKVAANHPGIPVWWARPPASSVKYRSTYDGAEAQDVRFLLRFSWRGPCLQRLSGVRLGRTLYLQSRQQEFGGTCWPASSGQRAVCSSGTTR